MLLEEAEATLAVCAKSIQQAQQTAPPRVDSWSDMSAVDPFVQNEIVGTNGNLYRHLVGTLPRYPIPVLRLPEAAGEIFLDIGCNWGRWCVAAARKGYRVIGIDPSLDAILAARRVAQQLGVTAHFLVADARFLPFRAGSFEVVFSYSVLQHFSESNVELVLTQIARVLKPPGICLVQMAGRYGVRNLLIQSRRGFRAPTKFEVRYWPPSALKRVFADRIGAVNIAVDGFFSLNSQPSDLDLLPWHYRLLVKISEGLRRISESQSWLVNLADSLYITARPAPAPLEANSE
jgi:SAM-dependent methyltransferase